MTNRAQTEYYELTANSYDEQHVAPGDGNFIALEYAAGLMYSLGIQSVLDVGAGTGRALKFLGQRMPDVSLFGMEPITGMLRQAKEAGPIARAVAEALPVSDKSVDAILATALMHHIPNPDDAIQEMIRVARRLILIADANRFGQGGILSNLLKFSLWKGGLWKVYMHVRTRGKGFLYSEGDGIFYSYSVFDSIPALSDWADRIFVIPTAGSARHWTGPLFGAPSALLVAVREPTERWAGR